MTPESRMKLRNLLIQQENFSQFVYTDITGHFTIGYGRNLTTRGVSNSEALYLLDDDIAYFYAKLSHMVKFFDDLDDVRQIVLVDMCFNLGVQGLLGFTQMLSALEEKDYARAAEEMLKSKAAELCPDRYERLAVIMRTAEI